MEVALDSSASLREPEAGNGAKGFGPSAIAMTAGALVAVGGLRRRTVPGLLLAGLGGALLLRGARATMRTVRSREGGGERRHDGEDDGAVHVVQAWLIHRSAEDLYRHWRDFTNLPAFMSHLEKVEVHDERRSCWVAKAPLVAGGKIEWEAEITEDEPGQVIAWRSLPGSEILMEGEVRFARAPGDRGTEMQVDLRYRPPGGRLGDLVAKVFGTSPRRRVREDLRNFKRIMELGHLPTTEGQPRGTCLPLGHSSAHGTQRERES